MGAGIGGLCLAQGLRRRDVEVVIFEQLPDGKIFADFDNGETATVRVLVDADGINSRVRQQLLAEARIETLPMDAIVCRSWVDAATGSWLTRS